MQKTYLNRGYALTVTAVFVLFGLMLHFRKSFYEVTTNSNNGSKKKIMFIEQEKQSIDYLKEMDELNQQKVDMDDPKLISLIRNYWIENPSEEPYNLENPEKMDPSVGQAAFVDNRLKFKASLLVRSNFGNSNNYVTFQIS